MPHDEIRDAASNDFLQQLFAINRVGRVLGAAMNRRMGLHRSQIALLGTLVRLGEARLAELACENQVDPSVISRQIVALENDGLITRRPDPEDKRAALLRLTDEGAATHARAMAIYRETALSGLADWSTEDIRDAAEALRRIVESHAPTTKEAGVEA